MRADRSERGFTLIEVTLATVITGIIVGAIATALAIMLGSYPSSASRLAQSSNAQLLSSWLIPDVQSASWSDANFSIDTRSGTPSSGCTGPTVGTNVVKLHWSDFDTGGFFDADYRLDPTTAQLMRYYCAAGGSPSLTVVGRDIASATAVQTGDSVDVHVETTKAIESSATCSTTSTTPDPACYSFDVLASRRTPALRVFAVPAINVAYVQGWIKDVGPPIAGTAEPSATVTLTVTDQPVSGKAPKPVTFPPITPLADGTWQSGLEGISWGNLPDGTITLQATDGQGHTATTTTLKRTTAPTVTVTATPPLVTDTDNPPLQFTMTFSSHVTLAQGAADGGVRLQYPPLNSPPPTATVGQLNCPNGNAQPCVASVSVAGLRSSDDQGDGPVRVLVNLAEWTDDFGNNPVSVPPTPPATDTITWDAIRPTASVSAVSPNPSNAFTLQYLVTTSKPVTGLSPAQLSVTLPPGDSTTGQPKVTTSDPPSNMQHFTASVQMKNSDTVAGDVSLTVNPGAVTDLLGLSNSQSYTSSIWWSALTINAPSGGGTVTFNGAASTGVADATTVTVDVCNDAACSLPTPIGPPITIGPGDQWNSGLVPLPSVSPYWARVSQVQAGAPTTPVTATTGPNA
jgi:prepilin-type N-terminal cleavage/methylation domain-containing protein